MRYIYMCPLLNRESIGASVLCVCKAVEGWLEYAKSYSSDMIVLNGDSPPKRYCFGHVFDRPAVVDVRHRYAIEGTHTYIERAMLCYVMLAASHPMWAALWLQYTLVCVLWPLVTNWWSTQATWLILPVVICLSQRLSHACLCTCRIKAKPRMAH